MKQFIVLYLLLIFIIERVFIFIVVWELKLVVNDKIRQFFLGNFGSEVGVCVNVIFFDLIVFNGFLISCIVLVYLVIEILFLKIVLFFFQFCLYLLLLISFS